MKRVLILLLIASFNTSVIGETMFNANYGMELLKQEKFDEAKRYFEKHKSGNALAYYGLASIEFRKTPTDISQEQLTIAIDLYEKSIKLDPNLSDSYFMCAMAYNTSAGIKLGGFNKNPNLISKDAIEKTNEQLLKAKSYFEKAVTLNPGFNQISIKELEFNKKLILYTNSLLENIK